MSIKDAQDKLFEVQGKTLRWMIFILIGFFLVIVGLAVLVAAQWLQIQDMQRELDKFRSAYNEIEQVAARYKCQDEEIILAVMGSALKYKIDPHSWARIIGEESSFNPKAESSALCRGLAQVNRDKQKNMKNPWEPRENCRIGAAYFKKQLDRFGDMRLALAAYNAGPQAVIDHKGIPPYRETQEYVRKIMGG